VVEYTDIFGERHSDTFILDADIYRDTQVVRTETIDDIGKALETIADVLKKSGLDKDGCWSSRRRWQSTKLRSGGGTSASSKQRVRQPAASPSPAGLYEVSGKYHEA
jgi:hypothetical protein